MPKSKKEKEENKVIYLKTNSVEDICRRACNFDFTTETIILSKFDKGSRLVYFGEKAETTQIAYYASTTDTDGIIMYEPGSQDVQERAVFTSKTDLPNKYYIGILRADLGLFPVAEEIDEKEVHIIRVQTPIDLVGAAIKKASREENVATIYSFTSEGKNVLAAFNILDSLADDKLVFYYTVHDSEKVENFARYDYRNNTLDFSNVMENHAYMYAKIIHLSEPFPFTM